MVGPIPGSISIAPLQRPLHPAWKNLGYMTEGVEYCDGSHPEPLTKAARQAYIDTVETLRSLDRYSFPQFYMTGIPQPKETTMIDRKNFVLSPVRVAAGSLAQKHLGSLVTVMLPSGAEITDILTGVRSGRPARQGDPDTSKVVVTLANVGVGYDASRYEDVHGEHFLDPKAVVLVRRPRPAAVAKKTKR